VPVRFVHAIVESLRDAGYLGPLAESNEVYVLLRAPEQIMMRDLLHKLLHAGADTTALGLRSSQLDGVVSQAVSQVLKAAEGTLDNMTVASLLREKA
jgi:DNA-binding IscR family transcriptional regulator